MIRVIEPSIERPLWRARLTAPMASQEGPAPRGWERLADRAMLWVVLVVVVAPCLLGALVYLPARVSSMRAERSRATAEAPGKVTGVKRVTSRSIRGERFVRADVRYEFRVGRATHTGSDVHRGEKVGDSVRVHYDPADPSVSFLSLEAHPSERPALAIAGSVTLVVVATGVLLVRERRRRKPVADFG